MSQEGRTNSRCEVHIPEAKVQRRLQENNRNSTTRIFEG